MSKVKFINRDTELDRQFGIEGEDGTDHGTIVLGTGKEEGENTVWNYWPPDPVEWYITEEVMVAITAELTRLNKELRKQRGET